MKKLEIVKTVLEELSPILGDLDFILSDSVCDNGTSVKEVIERMNVELNNLYMKILLEDKN